MEGITREEVIERVEEFRGKKIVADPILIDFEDKEAMHQAP
jgi:hypothetical protein